MNSSVEIVTRPRVPRMRLRDARITAFWTALRSVEKRDMMSPICDLRVEAGRQALQVLEHPQAEVVHHAGAEPRVQVVAADRDHRRGQQRRGDQPDQHRPQQRLVVLLDRLVEHVADRRRQEHRPPEVDQQPDEQQRDLPAVRPEVDEQVSQGAEHGQGGWTVAARIRRTPR
jgi:hypothetical protein